MAGYRKLGRTSNQRKAMIRGQVTSLLYNGKIVTTEARAKEVKKVAEGLIALAVKEKDNYDCIFLTKNGCSIYEGRPSQCRTYPFWESIVESRANWESEGKSCPGIGKGRKISRKEIEKELEKGRTNVPYMVFGKRRKK